MTLHDLLDGLFQGLVPIFCRQRHYAPSFAKEVIANLFNLSFHGF